MRKYSVVFFKAFSKKKIFGAPFSLNTQVLYGPVSYQLFFTQPSCTTVIMFMELKLKKKIKLMNVQVNAVQVNAV